MSHLDKSYFLGPEFAKNSSIPDSVADLLSLAADHGLYNVVGIELGELLDKYLGLLKTFLKVYVQIHSAPGSVDVNVRQDAAARFRSGAKIISNEIDEQVASFIDYLARTIEG